jgi:glycosyltransferase involved in cell wall biosynthesis
MKKKILLFSTLNPYPFWAGSEKFWFDVVTNLRGRQQFQFHVRLADSPVTRAKGALLSDAGVEVSFYKHFNVDFARRNIARLSDKVARREVKTRPWYEEIRSKKYDLVWFCVSTLQELFELEYAVSICKKLDLQYWISLQHSNEDEFLTNTTEMETMCNIASSARRFIFVSERNRRTLERAIGQRSENAFHSANTICISEFEEAKAISSGSPVRADRTARFFHLGRFAPRDKGQHLLLEAFGGESWKVRDWKLTFIGTNDLGRMYISKWIGLYGIDPKRIEIVPHIENVFSEIAKHDVLLMPSLAEGTPFAMIESMACGRAAMGTPVGGIPELIHRQNARASVERSIQMAPIWAGSPKICRNKFGSNGNYCLAVCTTRRRHRVIMRLQTGFNFSQHQTSVFISAKVIEQHEGIGIFSAVRSADRPTQRAVAAMYQTNGPQ